LSGKSLYALEHAPVWMTPGERLVLYALIVGIRPRCVLEIGTLFGGSAMIMCAAFDCLGTGRMVCVDPEPQIAPDTWAMIEHRAALVDQASPNALGTARQVAGEPFDFAFVDGDHAYTSVLADVEATLPHLAKGACLLFHDANNLAVRDAIDRSLADHPGELADAGMVSVEATTKGGEFENGQEVLWTGLRLLRYESSNPSLGNLHPSPQ